MNKTITTLTIDRTIDNDTEYVLRMVCGFCILNEINFSMAHTKDKHIVTLDACEATLIKLKFGL